MGETQITNQGIKLSAKYTLRVGLIVSLIVWLIVSLTVWLTGVPLSGSSPDLGELVMYGQVIAMVGGVASGSDIVAKHCILRLILWYKGYVPWNYARFLNYCHDRILLRKVGGGYIFIHRILMEHFASLTDDDIEQIAASIEASRR